MCALVGKVRRKALPALAMLLIMITAACGAAEDPALPTPRPTYTPSLEPSATFTRVFDATTTPTAPIISAVSTDGPSPTSLIGEMPTVSLFTLTPTLLSYAPGTLQIEYFTTSSTSVKPGDKITLFWSAKGVDKAIIYRLDSNGKRGQLWNVNRNGSLDIIVRPEDRDSVQFLLSIGNPASHLEQTLTVPVKCDDLSSFDLQALNPQAGPATGSPLPGCAASTPIPTTEVQQSFEHGQMIWLQQQARIYVLFNDGQQPAWAMYTDDFKDGQPDHDPSLQPPSGLLQPIRGFGLVWRTQGKVRPRLGWATAAEIPVDSAYQGDGSIDNGVMYIRVRDGNIIALYNKGASWKLLTR